MKCRVCRAPAVLDIRRHNAAFCREHFVRHCREQVRRAIDDRHMIAAGERVLVAVSGGKDSLALWDLLLDLGFEADGLYLGLGIGEYSEASGQAARSFARERGLQLREVDLARDHGSYVPPAALRAARAVCGSDTCSTRTPSSTDTTSPPRATTSMTKRRCSSGTCCDGRLGTSDASNRCSRRAPASRARSSRCTGSVSARR